MGCSTILFALKWLEESGIESAPIDVCIIVIIIIIIINNNNNNSLENSLKVLFPKSTSKAKIDTRNLSALLRGLKCPPGISRRPL